MVHAQHPTVCQILNRCFTIIQAILFAGILLQAGNGQAQYTEGTWKLNANGDWFASSNWGPNNPQAIPDGAGHIASFRFDISGDRVINLSNSVTIGKLILGDTSGSNLYSFTGGPFIFNSGNPHEMAVIEKEAAGGNDLISASIILNSGLHYISNNTTSTRAFRISGLISTGAGEFAPQLGTTALKISAPSQTTSNNQILSLSGSHNNTFFGQVLVEGGTLRTESDGGNTLLGAMGEGNETIVTSGGRLDLYNHDFNVNNADGTTEIFHIEGGGWRNLGALVNNSGTATVSHVKLTGDATFGGIGTFDFRGYTNTSTSTLVRGILDGGGHTLTKLGPNYLSFYNTDLTNLEALVIRESEVRLFGNTTIQAGTNVHLGYNRNLIDPTAPSFDSLDFSLGSRTQADYYSTVLGNNSILGARFEFNALEQTILDLNLYLHGKALIERGGAGDALPSSSYYNRLEGTIHLVEGSYLTNGFNLGGGSEVAYNGVYLHPGRMDVASKIINTGAGYTGDGFTKRGNRELRIVSEQDQFDGHVLITQWLTRSILKSSNVYTAPGTQVISKNPESQYYNFALAESGTLHLAKSIILEIGGSLTLLNEVNHNNRLNDQGTIRLRNGFLQQVGGTENNTENWGHVRTEMGSNVIYFDPRAGGNLHNTFESLAIEGNSVLRMTNMKMDSTFGTGANDAVKLRINDTSQLKLFGNSTANATADRVIVSRLFSHTVPTGVVPTSLVRKDILEGAMAWVGASLHFTTIEEKDGVQYLRPLTDSEYSTTLSEGVNWNITTAIAPTAQLITVPNVQEDITVNSIRLATSEVRTGSHEYLYVAEGKQITVTSGMILASHYVNAPTTNYETVIRGAAGATMNFNGETALFYNATSYLDNDTTGGAFSNYMASQDMVMRLRMVNANGLIKAGRNSLYLEANNQFTGDAYVNDGILVIRGDKSLEGIGKVVLNNDGTFYVDRGVNLKGFDILSENSYSGKLILYASSGHNSTFAGDIIMHNVDSTGNMPYRQQTIGGTNESTLTLYGDIYGTDLPLGFVDDDYVNDPRLISITPSTDDKNNYRTVVNLYGQFKDRESGALGAFSSTRGDIEGQQYDVNHLMRLQVRGNSDVNFNAFSQWNSSGQIDVTNGNFRIMYDPTEQVKGFYTQQAVDGWFYTAEDRTMSGLVNSGFHRISMGGPATSGAVSVGTANYSASIFLTKDGQVLNHPNIYIYNGNSLGNLTIGGENRNGTVYVGSDVSNGSQQARIVFENHGGDRDLRLYQMAGGTSEYNLRIWDNGTSVNTILTKVGRGTARLVDNVNAASNTERWNIVGGTMQWRQTQAGDNRFAIAAAQLIMAGGNLEYLHGPNVASNRAQTLEGVVRFLKGSSSISVIRDPGSNAAQTTTLTLGKSGQNLIRQEGATLNFGLISGGGTSHLVLHGTSTNTLLPWATYSTAAGVVNDFALVDSTNSNRVVSAASKGVYQSSAADLDLSQWNGVAKGWISETTASGFEGQLQNSNEALGVRFLSQEDSNLSIANGTTLNLSQGGILVATQVGENEKSVTGGNLTSTYKAQSGQSRTELFVHQYNPQGRLLITSNLMDSAVGSPMSVVYTGVGETVLSGNNTYTGSTYLLGGTVSVDSDQRLGAESSNLYIAGGTLKATENFTLASSRNFVIGGDGATFEVNQGKALTYRGILVNEGNVVSTENGFSINPQVNLYSGDFIKTGKGELIYAPTAENSGFSGMIEIKEGTFTVAPTLATADTLPNIFGTNNTAMDGLVIHDGGTLNLNLNLGWTTTEWLTLNGKGYMGSGAIRQTGAVVTARLNSQVYVETDTLLNIANTGSLQFNNAGGNIFGNGNLIKIGLGNLYFGGNSTEFKGSLILGSGSTHVYSDSGKFTSAESFVLQRDAIFNLEHSTAATNPYNDRINDDAVWHMEGYGRLRMTAQGVSQSGIENFGTLRIDSGNAKLQMYTPMTNDANGLRPASTYTGMQFNSIHRAAGSTFRLTILEVGGKFADANFGTSVLSNVGVFSIKDLNSLSLLGGDGSRMTNRKIIQGGHGGSYSTNVGVNFVNRDSENYTARRFLTVDQARNPETGEVLHVMRPLKDEEYFKVGASNENSTINSRAIGNLGIQADDNLLFKGRETSFANPNTTDLKTSFFTLDRDLTVNSMSFEIDSVNRYTGTTGSGIGERAQLYLGEGVTLKIDSGMITSSNQSIVDRDGAVNTGSVLNQTTYILGGTLDFNGQEGIINANSSWWHYNTVISGANEPGYGSLQATSSDFYINSKIVNMNGLTKSGERSLYLTAKNEYTGVTNITESGIYVRHRQGLGYSSEVRTFGTGFLVVQEGAQIKNTDLRVGQMSGGSRLALVLEGGASWGGNIIIDDVDRTGQAGNLGVTVQRNIIRASASIGTIHGDIYAEHEHEILGAGGTTAKMVSTTGGIDGVLYLKGSFKDTIDGAWNEKITELNQNQVLRFEVGTTSTTADIYSYNATNMRSYEEGAVWVDHTWDSVGRISIESGSMHYFGNGNFWTDRAAQNMNDMNAMSGFHLGGDLATATNQDANLAFYLTKSGQNFNIGNIGIGLENDIGNRLGNSTLGGLNREGEITFGTGVGSVHFDAAATTAYKRDLRLYQAGDGVMKFHFNFVDGGNLVESSLTKVGTGTTQLWGSSAGASSLDGLYVMSGSLQLAGYHINANTRLGNQVTTLFGGGTLEHLGDGQFTERLHQVSLRAGGSRLVARGQGAFNLTGAITRSALSTISFEVGGDGLISLENVAPNSKIQGYAVFGNLDSPEGAGSAWAFVGLNGVLRAYEHQAFEIDAFGAGWNTDVQSSQLVGGNTGSLRFGTANASVGSGAIELLDGGVLITQQYGGGVALESGATLGVSSAVTDLIIHNYAPNLVTFDGRIVADANLLFSGPGRTSLSGGAEGIKRLAVLNQATVQLGAWSNITFSASTNYRDSIYLNAGTISFTGSQSQTIDSRYGITLGAGGGTLKIEEVGGRVVYAGAIRSEHNANDTYVSLFGTSRTLESNPLAGDLNILGPGTFQIGEFMANPTAASDAGMRTNFYSGQTLVGNGVQKSIVEVRGHPANDTYVWPFGTHVGFEDGTVLRNESELRIQFQRSSVATSNARMLEYFTFGEKDSDISYLFNDASRTVEFAGNIRINGTLAITARNLGLDAFDKTTNGNIEFATYNAFGGQLIGNEHSRIIKNGLGALVLRDNNEHFAGEFEIRQGQVQFYGYGDVAGTGKTLILGDRTYTTSNIGDVILTLAQSSANSVYDLASETEDLHLYQNIRVYGTNSTTSFLSRQIRSILYTDDASTHFHGNIHIESAYDTGKLGLYLKLYGATPVNPQITGRGQNNWVFYNGDISGSGTGETSIIQFNLDDQVTPTPGPNVAPSYGTFILRGNNSGWKGEARIASENSTIDEYERVVLRLANNKALTKDNKVTMYRYASIQAAGSTVEIGNLTTSAGGTGLWVENGAVAVNSTTIIENAAKTDGHIKVFQMDDAVWYSMFRDGKTDVYWASKTQPDGSLHLTKDGTGAATMVQANQYTGVTYVNGGTLQVGVGGNTGARALALTVGTTGTGGVIVNQGGKLAGTGVVNTRSGMTNRVDAGGIVAPGDSAGNAHGTLHINGHLTIAANGKLQFQIQQAHQFTGEAWSALSDIMGEDYGSTLIALSQQAVWSADLPSTRYDHIELEGQLSLQTGSLVELLAATSYVNSLQVGDAFNLIDWGVVGGERSQGFILPTLQGSLVWETSLFNSHGILLVAMVPEPSKMCLIALALGAMILRRRRA